MKIQLDYQIQLYSNNPRVNRGTTPPQTDATNNVSDTEATVSFEVLHTAKFKDSNDLERQPCNDNKAVLQDFIARLSTTDTETAC